MTMKIFLWQSFLKRSLFSFHPLGLGGYGLLFFLPVWFFLILRGSVPFLRIKVFFSEGLLFLLGFLLILLELAQPVET